MKLKLMFFGVMIIGSLGSSFRQSPVVRIEQIVNLYNQQDFIALTHLMKTLDYQIEASLPSFQSESHHLQELTFSRQVEVIRPCRGCVIGQQKKELAKEQFSISGTVDNVRSDQAERLPNSSFLKRINISINEYEPYNNVLPKMNSHSNALKQWVGNKILSKKSCYLQYLEDNGHRGKYYFAYTNGAECDQSLKDEEYLVEEIWCEYFGPRAERLNDANFWYGTLLTTKIRIRNNRYYEISVPSINEVSIRKSLGGTFEVPVELNGVLKTYFTFDTGAADVYLSAEVASSLIKIGSLTKAEYLGNSTYVYADGRSESLKQYKLKSIRIGNRTINNVVCAVANDSNAFMLLGQSVLSRLGKFEFDYQRNLLIFK